MFGSIFSTVATMFGAKRGTSQMNAANARANQLTAETLKKAEKNAAPYMQAATGALPDLSRIAGVGADALNTMAAAYGALGAGPQKQFLRGMEASPLYQGGLAQGQTNILNSAAATGGLRGGNTQAALAELGPQMMAQYLDAMRSGLTPVATLGTGVGQNLAGQGAGMTQFLGGIGANAANVQGDRIRAIGSNQAARTGVIATQAGGYIDQVAQNIANLYTGGMSGGMSSMFGGTGGGTSATYAGGM